MLRDSKGRFVNGGDYGRYGFKKGYELSDTSKLKRANTIKEKQIFAKENNPNWKGGIYKDEDRKVRKTTEWKVWRKSVFERDNYTCQRCNKFGGMLHPHHIKKRCDFPDLIFDVDNGMTLCNSCHTIVHRTG